MSHMSDRYDFGYWPPMPIEQEPVVPTQSALVDEICPGLLYIADSKRRHQVYATGDWADIVDFWLEAEPPAESKLRVYPDGTHRVDSAWHLSYATRAFYQIAYEIAYRQCDRMGIDPNDLATQMKQEPVKFLYGRAFSQYEKQHSNQYVLLARQVITDMFDRKDPLPFTLADKSRLLIAKVALHWGEAVDWFIEVPQA